jgi:hypothetical protein
LLKNLNNKIKELDYNTKEKDLKKLNKDTKFIYFLREKSIDYL